MTRRKWMLVGVVAVLVTVAATVASVSSGSGEFVAETSQGALPVLKAGCCEALSALQNGKGKITVHSTYTREDGSCVETESENDVVFSGNRYRVDSRETYLKNDPYPGVSKKLRFAPGASRSGQASCDGQRVVLLKATDGAVVTDPETGEGRVAVSHFRRDLAVLTHGVWDLSHMDEVWRFPRAVHGNRAKGGGASNHRWR